MKLEEVVVQVKEALKEGRSVRVQSVVGDMENFEIEDLNAEVEEKEETL